MSPTSYLAAPSRDNKKEDKGFELLRRFDPPDGFQTVPFSQTWVILQYGTYNDTMDLVGLEPTTGRL